MIRLPLLLTLLALTSHLARADDPFFWGVANSSYQTEGAADDPDAPAHSNWWEWSHQWDLHHIHRIVNNDTADVTIDFWHRYDEDFALTQGLGGNAFRMSIEWSRVEPESGVFNDKALDHYEQMIVAMRARGIEPMVTLMHSTMPLWVAHERGVLGKKFPQYFAAYAAKVVQRLSGAPANVRYWMTLNEPATLAQGKYIEGCDPENGSCDPADIYDAKGLPTSVKGAPIKFIASLNGQVEAHLAAVAAIRALKIPGLKIGVATDWTPMEAPGHEPLPKIAAFFAQKVYDQYFLDGVTRGESNLCPFDLCPKFKYARHQKLPTLDFIGLNYYSRDVYQMTWIPFKFTAGPGGGPLEASGAEIYPQGMEESLKSIWKIYKLPILVSENGDAEIPDSLDQTRIQFLKDNIAYMQKAQTVDHIPVLGYLYWTLVDNLEWSKGYSQHYGLCSFDPVTLERHPRPSYEAFRQLIGEAKGQAEPVLGDPIPLQ